ncbi:hypothetical protein [Geoalkalibacter halelectricus]|uniref:hypothetical protein n=1 Tax=Geoalkalibacter halelectricus TaxID=2847045 RepID=UPI003D22C571
MRAMSSTLLQVWLFLAVSAGLAGAAVPPPPVNQFIGIPDTTFANLIEADCRFCHNQSPPIEAVDPTYLPDRHHVLLGQPIAQPSAAPYVAPGQRFYDCFNCHSLGPDPQTGRFTFEVFRDCTLCHRQLQGQPTVHHARPEAQAGQCVICHGNLVDDMDSGHYIPTYQPSRITPWPSNKPDGGPRGEGNCNFCHNTVALPFFDPTPVIDPASGVLVFRSAETHHATGFVQDAAKCVWCHNITPGINDAFSIRTCQNCHSVASLHNIQYDDQGDGIVPGQENPGFGHIGANSDCVGCHGFGTQAMAAPAAGPVTPYLTAASSSVATAGHSALISLYGTAFVSSPFGRPDLTHPCQVELTDPNGVRVSLAPLEVQPQEVRFRLPADLAPGTYRMRVVKAGRVSNPLALVVRPAPQLSSATCESGLVTLRGTGLGGHFPDSQGVTGVTAEIREMPGRGRPGPPQNIQVEGEILAWNDREVRARFAACAETITLHSIFGSITAPLEADKNSNKGSGKKIHPNR